jgi:hypothetical protein
MLTFVCPNSSCNYEYPITRNHPKYRKRKLFIFERELGKQRMNEADIIYIIPSHMTRFVLSFMAIFTTALVADAQIDHRLDSLTLQNDKVILQEILLPAIHTASEQHQEPDWAVIRTTLAARYDPSYADRNVTKAKIYFFYGKDWAQFCTAIVQYTQSYEYRDSLSLMNKNAKMILSHSQNAADWKAALGWVKYATAKEPSNEAYKATYDALTAKINGQ